MIISNAILLADCSPAGESVSVPIAAALASQQVSVNAVVISPDDPDPAVDRLLGEFNEPPPIIRTKRPDQDPDILKLLDSGQIEFIFSYFGYRVRPKLLNGAKIGGINVHPSVLPYNGGRHSAFWGITNGTSLGATVHWMDETFDTGDIIGQATFEDDGLLTAEEVYKKQLQLCVEVFCKYLPEILSGHAPRIPQSSGGSYHHNSEIVKASTFDGGDTITMAQLLKLGRATSFGSHGFFVNVDGRNFKVQTSISEVHSQS